MTRVSGGGATGLPEKEMKTVVPKKPETMLMTKKDKEQGIKSATKTESAKSVVTKPVAAKPEVAKTETAKSGTGKPAASVKYDLYIIHGWTYTVEPWRNTLAMLAEAGLKVKMLHVPGLTERSSKVFEIEDYVKWADQEIPDGAVALGHSNGGRILLNLCAKKPEKLKYLILLDAAGVYEPSARKRLVERVAKIGKPLKKVPLVDKAFHKITGSTDYSRAPENMKVTLANMLKSDQALDFSKVTTPTYILWGKKDTTTPPRQATAMYEKLPHAELKFYAKWTHAPYISDPEGLARAIMMLVGRLKK